MKKILLSIAVLMITVFYANAQSYTLAWQGETFGDTVVFMGMPDSVLVFEAELTNNSSDLDTIRIIRRYIDVVSEFEHSLCWGSCYPPNHDSIFAPAGYVVLGPGETSPEYAFSGHYDALGNMGTTLVEYTFFNINDESEKLTVVAKYVIAPDAIDENILNNTYVSDIYPNPAESFVNINYDMPVEVETANVKIVNLLGSVVMEKQLNTSNNKIRMNISNLNGGVYFYSLFINKDLYSTKKLIVR